MKEYSKIIIVGSSGSGKSHLAKQLAKITDLPLTHLDREYWQPGWVKTLREEWIAKQREFIRQDRWIIEGNYDGTMEIRFEAADLVIFLDINRLMCLVSALRRKGKKRSDMPDYLQEKFDSGFMDLCKWILSFPKKGKNTILALHERYPDKAFWTLKSRREVKKMINRWPLP